MNLLPVTERPDRYSLLWTLLLEREDWMNISHKEMPAWDKHVAFVDSQPYDAWYFIEINHQIAGAAYLTRQSEIGIQLFKAFTGLGTGAEVVRRIMELHGPRRFVANVNPANLGSARMFQRLGFNLVQHSYALDMQ
jgi:RimJ/RimL family protein N-acetyltransferase